MEALRQPLSRLVESLQWFVAAREVRALHVVTSESLRLTALRHVAAQEHDPRNQAPFLILEAPVEEGDAGWVARTEELRADMAELKQVLAEAERPTQIAAMPAAVTEGAAVVRFALELKAALDCLSEPIEGLVIALAPVWVRDAATWNHDLNMLMTQTELQGARWIVVDNEEPVSAAAIEQLEPDVERVDAKVDPAAAQQDFAAMLAQLKAAPAGARGPQLAGFAGPKELAPQRVKQAPQLSLEEQKEVLEQAGLPPGYGDVEGLNQVRILVLEAAQALQQGQAELAVRHQRQAADKSAELGLKREALLMELVMGTYALQGGSTKLALPVLEKVRDNSVEQGFADLAVQAELARGGALLAARRNEEAATAYAQAGKLGLDMDEPLLGIEGYRMAGQLLSAAGKPEPAIRAWRLALEASDKATPEQQAASTAPEVARALAAVCQQHGLKAQAASLIAQAERMEGQSTPAQEAAQQPQRSL